MRPSTVRWGGISCAIPTQGTSLWHRASRLFATRALVRRPSLLILDEPTNHLDGSAVAELLANIREMSPCATILMISHDRQALDWADQVITIRNAVVSSETPEVLGYSV